MQITPHGHVQVRILEQRLNVVVPPVMDGILAVEQSTPHEQREVTLFQKVED